MSPGDVVSAVIVAAVLIGLLIILAEAITEAFKDEGTEDD